MLRTIFSATLFLAASMICSASSLYFTGSGTFSNTDSSDLFVTPGDTFSFTFVAPSNPVTNSSNSTSLSFDVAPLFFSYDLNGHQVNVGQPTEMTFYTSADGGGVAVEFPSAEFIFGNSQYFAGSTSAPVFSAATFANENFVFLDNSNFDSGAAKAQLTPTPEPSSLFLLCGGLSLAAVGFRKLVRTGA